MCGLNIYIYPENDMRIGFNKTYFSHCLFRTCTMPNFKKFNTLAFTPEIQIYERLRKSCNIITNHEYADLLIVPFWYGTAIVSGWAGIRPLEVKKSWNHFNKLTHFNNQTAHKHVFFSTVDSQFVVANENTRNSVWFHLGDDYYTGSPMHNKFFLPQSIAVPYQLSQWVDGNIEITSQRHIFLYSNTNLKKHAGRHKLQDQIFKENQGHKFNIILNKDMQNVREASIFSQKSKFCLCPTGDSKGLTARFYFSIVHGCVPVWIDIYKRHLSSDELALPFKNDIDWTRLMVRIEYGEKILSHLKNVVVDYEYLKSSVHKLRYDRNASIFAVQQLERMYRTNIQKNY